MGIGTITITAARSVAVDFTDPYKQEVVSFLGHVPFPLAKWRSVYFPFAMEVKETQKLLCLNVLCA